MFSVWFVRSCAICGLLAALSLPCMCSVGLLRLAAVRRCRKSIDGLPGLPYGRAAQAGQREDGVIMMLVSYRPLAAGVLLALLERYTARTVVTRGPLVRPRLIRSIQVLRERCPQLQGIGWRYGAFSGALVYRPRLTRPNPPPHARDRRPARRETSVYTDEASSSLLAFTGHEAPAGGPAVRVLPADASPALEAALWAVRTPRGNRDLQR